MVEARHGKQTIVNGIHSAISYEYTDAAARNAATGFDALDEYKLAVQQSDNTIWLLTDPVGPTWIQVTTGIGTTSVTFNARKGTAGSISIGQAAYITGYDVGNSVVLIELAQANSLTTMPCVGICSSTITNLSTGIVLVSGILGGLNTSGFTINDALHVSSSVAGGLVTAPPAGPNIHQNVAAVSRVDASNGIIVVNVTAEEPLSDTAPANVTKAAATAGTSAFAARQDHKHDIDTAVAVSVGTTNAEGSSTSLSRADHTHAVTGLSIASQAQGDILYYNGSAWVRLAASTDGYYLQTNGPGQNPSWETVIAKRFAVVEFAMDEDVFNTTQYFFSWRGAGADTPGNKRSGSATGIQNAGTCSPYQVPFNATIISAVLTVRGVGVQNGTVTYPVTFQTDLFEQDFTTETKIADIDFSISNSFTVGTFSVGATNFKGTTTLSVNVDSGDMLGLKFVNGTGASLAGQMRNAFVSLLLEER